MKMPRFIRLKLCKSFSGTMRHNFNTWISLMTFSSLRMRIFGMCCIRLYAVKILAEKLMQPWMETNLVTLIMANIQHCIVLISYAKLKAVQWVIISFCWGKIMAVLSSDWLRHWPADIIGRFLHFLRVSALADPGCCVRRSGIIYRQASIGSSMLVETLQCTCRPCIAPPPLGECWKPALQHNGKF